MTKQNFWDNLRDAAKYARSTSTPDGGGAYYVTSQAKEDLREQGKEGEAQQIEKAEAIGTVGGAIAGLTLGKGVPALMRGVKAFRTAHPIISGAIDTGLTIDGVRNALSDNGIQKTINYATDGNWGRAAASGTVDVLDLLGGVGLVDDVIKVIPKIQDGYNFLKQFKGITGYNNAHLVVLKGKSNFGDNIGSGFESSVFQHPNIPDQVLKIHRNVAPYGEWTFYGIKDAVTAKNKIPHFNKEDYVGWVYDKANKRLYPVYSQKKFNRNADLPESYRQEALTAADKQGVEISDLRRANIAQIGNDIIINDLGISGYPKTGKTFLVEDFWNGVVAAQRMIHSGKSKLMGRLENYSAKIITNRMLNKLSKSPYLQSQVATIKKVMDTNHKLTKNAFFSLIKESYPNFDQDFLEVLHNMYWYDEQRFLKLLDTYKTADTSKYNIVRVPIEQSSNSGGSFKQGGTVKKKNKGKFSKVRDYVDYKNNK